MRIIILSHCIPSLYHGQTPAAQEKMSRPSLQETRISVDTLLSQTMCYQQRAWSGVCLAKLNLLDVCKSIPKNHFVTCIACRMCTRASQLMIKPASELIFKIFVHSVRQGEWFMYVSVFGSVCVLPSGIVFMALKSTLCSVSASDTHQIPSRISQKNNQRPTDHLVRWSTTPSL